MSMTRRRLQRGMTLIELLIVVAIVGVLAAVAIWNYFLAIDRAKQKRTMADMRAIALSWESYATDSGSYVPSGAEFTFPSALDWTALHDALVPRYSRNLPANDAWGHRFDIGLDSGPNGYYAIRSRGKDGLLDPSYDEMRTSSFDCDIIYSNGSFVIYPRDTTN